MKLMPDVINNTGGLAAEDGNLFYTNYQELPDNFWQDLHRRKNEFQIDLDGFTDGAVIPSAIVDKWIQEGFDFYNADFKSIREKLRIDGMETFIICKDSTFD